MTSQVRSNDLLLYVHIAIAKCFLCSNEAVFVAIKLKLCVYILQARLFRMHSVVFENFEIYGDFYQNRDFSEKSPDLQKIPSFQKSDTAVL